jgi:hypothetical protein
VEYIKSSGCDYRYKQIDIAFDVEIFGSFGDFDIDNFFLFQFSKSCNVNSPFHYEEYEYDGSRTYYLLTAKKPKIRTYMYLKHVKEGLKNRFILRLEISCNVLSIGNDPEKIIEYIEKDFKTKKLFFFNNVIAGNKIKQQYRANIHKKGSQNVPPKLHSQIQSNSDNEFPLVLTDEIKDHIRHVLKREKPKEEMLTDAEIKHELYLEEQIRIHHELHREEQEKIQKHEQAERLSQSSSNSILF